MKKPCLAFFVSFGPIRLHSQRAYGQRCAVTLYDVFRSRTYRASQTIFFQCIYTLYLALFCAFLIETELFNKECAVVLNKVFKWNMMVIAQLYEKTMSWAYFLSLCSILAHASPAWCLWWKDMQQPWLIFAGPLLRSNRITQKSFSRTY